VKDFISHCVHVYVFTGTHNKDYFSYDFHDLFIENKQHNINMKYKTSGKGKYSPVPVKVSIAIIIFVKLNYPDWLISGMSFQGMKLKRILEATACKCLCSH